MRHPQGLLRSRGCRGGRRRAGGSLDATEHPRGGEPTRRGPIGGAEDPESPLATMRLTAEPPLYYLALQMGRAGEAAGVGHGLFVYSFEGVGADK